MNCLDDFEYDAEPMVDVRVSKRAKTVPWVGISCSKGGRSVPLSNALLTYIQFGIFSQVLLMGRMSTMRGHHLMASLWRF